jgi:hypothetical protein
MAARSTRIRLAPYALAALLGVPSSPARAQVSTGADASFAPFVACNGRVGFRTSELLQAGSDLNGDGDALDFAFQVLTLGSGAITGVGIDASGALACGGDLFAFGVGEHAQGNADINGDLDTFDFVLHVYDAGTSTLTSVGLPVASVVASPSLVAFAVPELSQGLGGTDLNGDGDTDDRVLHVFDPVTAATTNVGQEAGSASNIIVVGTTVAFVTSEAAQGGTDLNGDGDAGDTVLQVYDAATATLTNTMQQAQLSPPIQFVGDVIAFLVSEAKHGGVSLNGDLDTADLVAHLYCLNAPPCVSAGVVNLAVDASGGFELAGDLLAVGTRERSQLGINLNPPDADARDIVAQIYRISTNTLASTGLAKRGRMRIVGDRVALAVPERFQNNSDRNGDGDTTDVVIALYDAGLATVTNPGRAVWWRGCPEAPGESAVKAPCYDFEGDLLLIATAERQQGFTDLNGDTDTGDAVVEAYQVSTGTLTNTGLSLDRKGGLFVGGTLGAFRVSERFQGADLNGDLDVRDAVMAVFDLATGTTTQLGQQAQRLFLVEASRVIFRTGEREQAADLNGDGDQDDGVLQYQAF